jgi:hypothetical protein
MRPGTACNTRNERPDHTSLAWAERTKAHGLPEQPVSLEIIGNPFHFGA